MVYDMTGVDVGFENPIFACLELDYEDVDEDATGEALEMLTQTLTFYELDLGRAWSWLFLAASAAFSLLSSLGSLLSALFLISVDVR